MRRAKYSLSAAKAYGYALIGSSLLLSGCSYGDRYGTETGYGYPTQSSAHAENYERNHPIRVITHKSELIVETVGGENAILSERQKDDLTGFVNSYQGRARNQRLSLLIPADSWDGEGQARLVAMIVDQLAVMGISEGSYTIGQLSGDTTYPYPRISLRFSYHQLSPPACKDWEHATGRGNYGPRLTPQLGCITQHNLAVQIADPEDFVAPGELSPYSAARGAQIYDNYTTGQTTSSQQSGSVDSVSTSDVDN